MLISTLCIKIEWHDIGAYITSVQIQYLFPIIKTDWLQEEYFISILGNVTCKSNQMYQLI